MVDATNSDQLADVTPTTEPIAFRVMNIKAVAYELSDASPFVELEEAEDLHRRLRIPLALGDAIALRHATTKTVGRRPSSHELFTAMLNRLQIDVICARIVRMENAIFYGEIDIMTSKGRETFDCRVSDALILAQRQTVPAPVLCAEDLLSPELPR